MASPMTEPSPWIWISQTAPRPAQAKGLDYQVWVLRDFGQLRGEGTSWEGLCFSYAKWKCRPFCGGIDEAKRWFEAWAREHMAGRVRAYLEQDDEG